MLHFNDLWFLEYLESSVHLLCIVISLCVLIKRYSTIVKVVDCLKEWSSFKFKGAAAAAVSFCWLVG